LYINIIVNIVNNIINIKFTKDTDIYLYNIINIDNNKHIDTICTCPGFKWRGYCKHIDKYNVNKSDLWKNSKNI